jgi:hypothetical protein
MWSDHTERLSIPGHIAGDWTQALPARLLLFRSVINQIITYSQTVYKIPNN